MNSRTIPRMMSVHRAAETGILPEFALRRLVQDGTIPAVYSGKTAYINFDGLCRYLETLVPSCIVLDDNSDAS